MLSRDKEHGEETEEALTTLRRGYAKIRNYPPGSTEFWLLLYSKRFLRLPTCGLKWSMPRGTGARKQDSCTRECWACVTVRVVVCDLLWPTGKNYLSHTPALRQSPSQGCVLLVNWS